MGLKLKEYAMYRGDEFIDIGTIKELSDKYSISKDKLYWLASPSHLRRYDKVKKHYQGLCLVDVTDYESEDE